MKRLIGAFLCIAVLTVFPGCGSTAAASRTGNQSGGVNEVLAEGMAQADAQSAGESGQSGAADTEASGSPEEPAVRSAEADTEQVDIDLTALSSTMVYSEVYGMMTEPEGYIGKTVKMKGMFAFYHDEASDKYYFACIVKDATACCAQGLEFELTGDYHYPEDYPEAGDEVTVVGVFDTYTEGEFIYITLRNAKLL